MKSPVACLVFLISAGLWSQAPEYWKRPIAMNEHWGPEEGAMTWPEAVARCESKGMRLPYLEEILTGTGSNVLLGFEWDRGYWSITTSPMSGRPFGVDVKNFAFEDLPAETSLSVRCTKWPFDQKAYLWQRQSHVGYAQSWNEADAECKSQGMRLPTIEELDYADKWGPMVFYARYGFQPGSTCSTFFSSDPQIELAVMWAERYGFPRDNLTRRGIGGGCVICHK